MRLLRLGLAGMRGEVGTTGITPPLITDYAAAFGTYIEEGPIVVGCDNRISSPMISHTVNSALMSCGCDVYDAGICPAPVVQFLVSHLKAKAGIIIGGGHHPGGWNAVVPLSETGAYLNSIEMQEFLDIYHAHSFDYVSWNKVGKNYSIPENDIDKYIEFILRFVDVDLIKSAGFKVVTDFCNGSGERLSDKFSELLGIELITINDKYSGILPHDPEPRPRSAIQIHSLMRYIDADIGFLFNSDMSRTSIVTSSGETLSEEYTFPLAADYATEKFNGNPVVVTNCCTTKTLDLVVEKNGGKVIKTKVGQANIIDKMQEIGADLAGDGSGSFALNNSIPGFDSFITMCFILESMAKRKITSHELISSLPRYHIKKKKIYCSSAHAYSMLRKLKDHFSDAISSNETDGFRFDWNDGWIHLRASMTEPVVRMIIEWKSEYEANEKAIQVSGLLERLVAS